jgi:hypothetical protein
VANKKNTTGEQSKEQKTERELEAMARQRLGCAVPVRRDAKGGWYFQVIEAMGLTSAHTEVSMTAEIARLVYPPRRHFAYVIVREPDSFVLFSGRGGRVVLPARLSGSVLRVNRGSYNGCGGAADQSEDQGRQDEELPHGNSPNRSLASFCF